MGVAEAHLPRMPCICPGCPNDAEDGPRCFGCWSARRDGHEHRPCPWCDMHIGDVTYYTKGRHELYCEKNPNRADYEAVHEATIEDEGRDRAFAERASGW